MDEKKKQASGPVKWILIGISVIFLFVMLVLPLVVVVTQALSKGWECYVQAVTDEYTLKALALTIEATVAAVVCNTIFGLCAAWAMTRFYFRGKNDGYCGRLYLSDRKNPSAAALDIRTSSVKMGLYVS